MFKKKQSPQDLAAINQVAKAKLALDMAEQRLRNALQEQKFAKRAQALEEQIKLLSKSK